MIDIISEPISWTDIMDLNLTYHRSYNRHRFLEIPLITLNSRIHLQSWIPTGEYLIYIHQWKFVNTEQTASYHNTNCDSTVYLSMQNPSVIYSTSSATTISRTKVLYGGTPNLTTGFARMVTNVAQIEDLGENNGNQGQTWFRDWNMGDWNIMNGNTWSICATHAHRMLKTDWTVIIP